MYHVDVLIVIVTIYQM